MNETKQITAPEEQKEKLYTEKDFEEFKKKIQDEFSTKETELKTKAEKDVERAGMTELEAAKSELEELKQKYREKEDECLIQEQKKQTADLLKDAKLDSNVLDLVYVQKDMDATRKNIEILKTVIEKTKQEVLKEYIGSPVPEASQTNPSQDPFIVGFDSNRLQ